MLILLSGGDREKKGKLSSLQTEGGRQKASQTTPSLVFFSHPPRDYRHSFLSLFSPPSSAPIFSSQRTEATNGPPSLPMLQWNMAKAGKETCLYVSYPSCIIHPSSSFSVLAAAAAFIRGSSPSLPPLPPSPVSLSLPRSVRQVLSRP